MKKSYERSVDVFVIIFILLSLLISSFALASPEETESRVTHVFEEIESSLFSLKSRNMSTKLVFEVNTINT